MTQSARRYLRLSLGVSLAAMAIHAASAVAQAPAANPPVVFAQTQSDLAVDPAARFGRLPNGMTYVIYKNKTPPGAAYVRMRVAAGSVMEQENQQGLAHFIEHMAFDGSKSVPEGDMVKLLERDGLKFGADTNAQTSHFETIYMLNLPDASDHVVDDALFLMRETAGNVSFNPAAIDRERGAILGEERLRDSVNYRAGVAETKLDLLGTKYPERMPIGKIDVIKTAQRPALVQFYNDFYRPEYTTLIVAGDIDPNRIEAEIKRRFSDWQPGAQSPAALTDFGALTPRTAPESKVYIAEGLQDEVSLTWTAAPTDAVETKAKELEDGRWLIADAILSQRFARAAKSAGSPFTAAAFGRRDVPHTARLYSMNIRPKEGQDAAAFATAVAMLREYIANGPTQSELDRVLLNIDRSQAARAEGARTRSSEAIAGQILQSLSDGLVLQSPKQDFEEFEALKPKLTLAGLKSTLSQVKLSDPPVLWHQDKKAGTFDAAAMLTAYQTAMAAPLTVFIPPSAAHWPYTQFGPASAVVSREGLPKVGATRVTFANGVILTVKPTDFEDKTVDVSVQVGDGVFGVRPQDSATLFMARRVGLTAGGLGKLSSDDVSQALAGKLYGLSFSIGADATVLNGRTTDSDFPVQMQVLAAYLSDPGLSADALDRLKTVLPSSYDAMAVSPAGIYTTKAMADLYGGDPRFGTPTLKDALAVRNSDVAALIKDQLGHGPVEVAIVGDITVDEAIKQVGATLGALPQRAPAVRLPGADQVHFPTTDLHRVYTHDGRSDQNLSLIVWPTADYYSDERRTAGLDLLAAVLTGRELEEVRKKQGATYTAGASNLGSRDLPGFGYLLSNASVRPEADEQYYETVSAIADDLKQRPITADEMNRARAPLIDRLHNERSSNGYWMSLLSGDIRDPRKIASAEARERDLLSITPQDLQTLAQTYLDMSKALHIQIKPKASAPTTP
jgi:zinc protease